MILKQGKSIYFMQEVHAMDLMFSVIGHYQPLFLVLVLKDITNIVKIVFALYCTLYMHVCTCMYVHVHVNILNTNREDLLMTILNW